MNSLGIVSSERFGKPTMPREKKIPSYRLHIRSGQTIVLTDRWHLPLLGKFDTPDGREKYDWLIGEWLAAGRTTIVAEAAGPTVSVVLAKFMEHAKQYCPDTCDGNSYDLTSRIARRLYGGTTANAFGPRPLKPCGRK